MRPAGLLAPRRPPSPPCREPLSPGWDAIVARPSHLLLASVLGRCSFVGLYSSLGRGFESAPGPGCVKTLYFIMNRMIRAI